MRGLSTRRVLIPASRFPPGNGDPPGPAASWLDLRSGAPVGALGVEMDAALAADLALLTEALDEPGVTIAESIRQLDADVRLTVASYLGLGVLASGAAAGFAFTVVAERAEVRASIMIPLARLGRIEPGSAITVILYAGTGGAFVDLAADLAWLTGAAVEDFALDVHGLTAGMADGVHGVAGSDLPGSRPVTDRRRRVFDESLINQAVGILLGRGLTPEQALQELDNRAAAAGTDRCSAAQRIADEV